MIWLGLGFGLELSAVADQNPIAYQHHIVHTQIKQFLQIDGTPRLIGLI